MKQVWVNLAACSVTPSTTRGALLPTETTAIPDPKSISELPSTSCSTPPPAALTNTGSTLLTPRATLRCRRSSSAREAGPGISVTSVRCCGRSGPEARVVCSVIPQTISHLWSTRLCNRWLVTRTRGRPARLCWLLADPARAAEPPAIELPVPRVRGRRRRLVLDGHVGLEDGRAVRNRQLVHLGHLECALDVAGRDCRNLVRVDETQPTAQLPDPQHLGAGQLLAFRMDRGPSRSGVHHDAVEQVELGYLKDVLDYAELLTRPGYHREAQANRPVRHGRELFIGLGCLCRARRVGRHGGSFGRLPLQYPPDLRRRHEPRPRPGTSRAPAWRMMGPWQPRTGRRGRAQGGCPARARSPSRSRSCGSGGSG